MADPADVLSDSPPDEVMPPPEVVAPPKEATPPIDEAGDAEAGRKQAAIKTARGVKGQTPYDLAPRPKSPDEYASVMPGMQWVDPEGTYRTKPYEPKSPEDYRKVPEGSDWLDPEGGVHTKPVYEDIGFTAQTLYNMATNDKEKRKALEFSYPGRVKEEPGTGDLYVEDEDGSLRRPRGFVKAPFSTLAAGAAPMAGAIGGEIAGGALGTLAAPGPGTAAGAVGGAGVGAGLGQGFNDLFLKGLDIYDRSAEEEMAELGMAGLMGTGGSAIGRLLGAKAAVGGAATRASPSGLASKALGVDPEGLDLALQLKGKGVENIPPSMYAKESPHLVNLVEVFDRTFNAAQPLQQSAEKHFETQGKDILGKLGADPAKVGSLVNPTAAVPTKDAGEKILATARQRVEDVNQKLGALLDQQGQAGGGKQLKLKELQVVEKEARDAASNFLNATYKDIEKDIGEGFKLADSGRNSGELWEKIANKFVSLKRAANAEANRQYGLWTSKYGEVVAPESLTLAEEAENFMALLPPEFKSQNPGLIRNLAKMGGIRDPETGELVKAPEAMTLGELHNLRTLFRANINWWTLPSDIVNGAKKLFEGKINSVIQSGPKDASKDLNAIDKWYGQEFEIFNEKRLQAVINGLEGGEPADPRSLYDVMVKEGRSDLNSRIERMVGPNLWSGVRAADADALMQSAKTETEGVVDGGRFIRGVLDRHRSGMLESIHGKKVAQQWLDQVRNLKLLDGKLDIASAPGDRIPDVIARVRQAVDAIRAEKEVDPLKLLGREMQQVKMTKRAFKDEELGFLYDPNMGAEEAVNKLLSSPRYLYAAEKMFGRDSDEFRLMQQIYTQRILQGEMEPGKKLADISPEVQKLMFPGITHDDMQMLAKEMNALMGTRALQDQAKSMAAQAKVEHPTTNLPGLRVVSKFVGADFVARSALGAYYGFVRSLTSKQWFLEFLKKGLKSNDPAVQQQARDAMKAQFRRYMQVGGPVGAGTGEAAYQYGGEDQTLQ